MPCWPGLSSSLGSLAFVPFVRYERAQPEPIIDVRLVAHRGQWPIQLTAFLFGIPVLGGQIPLSTFAQADPAVARLRARAPTRRSSRP